MRERVIVTGGAGFIGSHLVRSLIEDGYFVTILDNMSTACRENIHPDAELLEGDVSDPKDLGRLPREGIKAVYHLAAQSSGEASFDDPHIDFKSNLEGSFRVLLWCRDHGVKRFVFTSSMAAYGKSSEAPLDEETPCTPTSFYGTAKLATEGYVRFFGNLGLDTTIVRLFNVYGSGQNLGNMKQGMASIYLAYLLQGLPIEVKGSLERFRDQTHVSDAVAALRLVLDNPASFGRTYNIATGRKCSVRELINALFKAAGAPPDYPVQAGGGTSGDIFGCYADVTRAASELGWRAKVGVEEGVAEMYRFFTAGRSHA